MIRILCCFWVAVTLFCSCNNKGKDYPSLLHPVDSFLTYALDSDVKIPLFIRTCTSNDGKEYLYFQNSYLPELLIYDVHNGSLVNRTVFEVEGSNAVKGGFLNGFMMSDFEHIYIAGLADCSLYETDTTGYIKKRMNYAVTSDGYKPVGCFKENGTFRFLNGKIYLTQSLNWQLGEEVMEKSSLLCCIDTLSGNATSLPIGFPTIDERMIRGTASSLASEYKCCFDGRRFVYSFAYMDDLLVVDPITCSVEYKQGKSQYINKIQCPSYQGGDDQVLQRRICESPSYGNILYDPDNGIYYRIVYIPQEIDSGVEMLPLLRSGRKQFSIQIFDNRLSMIGEHVFPSYTYNSRLCFVTKGKLYISTNHVMNPDYSDDVLSFQMFEPLIKTRGY